jgi:aspartyl-tRNA synthetase
MPFNSGGYGGFGNHMPHHASFQSGPVIVNCSELRDRHVGAFVQISGRLSSIRAGRFAELRDMHGVTQLIATDDVGESLEFVKFLKLTPIIAFRNNLCCKNCNNYL